MPFSMSARSQTATSLANLLNSRTCVSSSVDHRFTISSIVFPRSIDGGATAVVVVVAPSVDVPAAAGAAPAAGAVVVVAVLFPESLEAPKMLNPAAGAGQFVSTVLAIAMIDTHRQAHLSCRPSSLLLSSRSHRRVMAQLRQPSVSRRTFRAVVRTCRSCGS